MCHEHFQNKTFTELEHREKTFVFKSKINISHWVKCSGLGWPKRKFVNSAYFDFLPQLDHNCSALPGPGWPSRDLSAWAHCEGSSDAFRVAAGTTMVSLTQSTPLTATVKTAACLENYYSCLCWPILRGSGAEIPSLWGHAQPPTLLIFYPLEKFFWSWQVLS